MATPHLSIKNELATALREAREARKSGIRGREAFENVLTEAVEAIRENGVDAFWKDKTGNRASLMLAPVFRPERATASLDLVFHDDGVELRCAPYTFAKTPEQLREALKDWLTRPTFLESIDELMEQKSQPVEAFLRERPGEISRSDVMFEVPAEVQEAIANAAETKSEIQCDLEVSSFVGAGEVDLSTAYRVLDSAGYRLTLTQSIQPLTGTSKFRMVGLVRRW